MINGLLLVGGRSRRMGSDKAWLPHGEQPQWQYLYHLMAPFVDQVYLSLRADQVAQFPPEVPSVIDSGTDLGPMDGLLAAFAQVPDSAWLVLACDLPYMTADALQQLISARADDHIATAFQNPDDGLPEPLIALWEPASYHWLQIAHQQGRRSPRRVLMSQKTMLIAAYDPAVLQNVNRPEDLPFSS